MEDGGIWMFGGKNRGLAADGTKLARVKIAHEMMKAMAKKVDDVHSTGKVIFSKTVFAFLMAKYQVQVHSVTAGQLIKEGREGGGLVWAPIPPSKMTSGKIMLPYSI